MTRSDPRGSGTCSQEGCARWAHFSVETAFSTLCFRRWTYPLAASAVDIVPLLVFSSGLLFAPLCILLSAPLVYAGSPVVHSRLFGWIGALAGLGRTVGFVPCSHVFKDATLVAALPAQSNGAQPAPWKGYHIPPLRLEYWTPSTTIVGAVVPRSAWSESLAWIVRVDPATATVATSSPST
jgi:hypothetical protein